MSFTKTPLKQPAFRSAPPRYKRGIIIKDGKLYGRYPDGSLYRIYSTDRSFSWWTLAERRFFASVKPPNWATQIALALVQPTSVIHLRL